MKARLRDHIKEELGVADMELHPISGGSINDAWHITANKKQYFCKLNSASRLPGLFEKEISGLEALRNTKAILTPAHLRQLQYEDHQLLLMEWIEPGQTTKAFWETFGQQLAMLHSSTNDQCGYDYDNYLGSIAQSNTYHQSWSVFFSEKRLAPLVQSTAKAGKLDADHQQQFENLYKKLPELFDQGPYSLLHGDLWSGNYLVNKASFPVLIDPAVYYGHRTMDIGMTMLFGGFDEAFYESYHYHFPLPKNYKEQCEVANLYPLLVHLELFGRSYLGQVETILNKYS